VRTCFGDGSDDRRALHCFEFLQFSAHFLGADYGQGNFIHICTFNESFKESSEI
jgi:hypothetical protein